MPIFIYKKPAFIKLSVLVPKWDYFDFQNNGRVLKEGSGGGVEIIYQDLQL